MSITFDVATQDDIDELIRLRIAYMIDDFGSVSPVEKAGMEKQLPDYFKRKLGSELVAFTARDEGRIVAVAYLHIIEMPANSVLLNGRFGDVLSVYTEPEYRGRGLCTTLMKNLVEYGKKIGLGRIDLKATDDGYPVYAKVGFKETEQRYRNMRLNFERTYPTVEFEEVKDEDIELLHKMQVESFMPLYEKYHDDMSPAIETVERIRNRAKAPGRKYFFIVKDGVRVGAVNIGTRDVNDKETYYISPIFILPEYQNQGIAYAAIMKAFDMNPEIKKWKLDTILQEKGNCHLYEKCGFVRVGGEEIINDKMTIIFYELNL